MDDCIEGLLECHEESDAAPALKGLDTGSYSQMTIQISGIVKTLQALFATVWWEFHDPLSTQDHTVDGIAKSGTATVLVWKVESPRTGGARRRC